MSVIETYLDATDREIRLRQAAEEAAAERSQALAELHRSGMSYGRIADATGLSRSRVQQLVERYRITLAAGGAEKVRQESSDGDGVDQIKSER